MNYFYEIHELFVPKTYKTPTFQCFGSVIYRYTQ